MHAVDVRRSSPQPHHGETQRAELARQGSRDDLDATPLLLEVVGEHQQCWCPVRLRDQIGHQRMLTSSRLGNSASMSPVRYLPDTYALVAYPVRDASSRQS